MSACDLSLGYLVGSFLLGLILGTCAAAAVAGVIHKAIDPPDLPDRAGKAFDLDDKDQRRAFEELLRRKGGRP